MIKYETKEGFDGDMLFRITEQTYRGAEFCNGKIDFTASNKIIICSMGSPAINVHSRNIILYVRGIKFPRDNDTVLISGKHWLDVEQALFEYNVYISSTIINEKSQKEKIDATEFEPIYRDDRTNTIVIRRDKSKGILHDCHVWETNYKSDSKNLIGYYLNPNGVMSSLFRNDTFGRCVASLLIERGFYGLPQPFLLKEG